MDMIAKIAAALILASASLLQPSAAAAETAPTPSSEEPLTTLEKSGEWTISVADGQCNASKALPPPAIGQFAIGITPEGTYLHLQNLRWSLPATATNSMPVEVSFDGSAAFRTDALLIGMVRAFQIFVHMSDMPDELFWKRYLAARSMRVTGPFRPGAVDIDLKDSSQMIAPLRNCATRYLPGVKLPF